MSTTAVKDDAGAKPQAVGGRDARGRFAKGNAGGPGNPFARKVAALRAALVNFVTEDDMKHVAFILKERAESGNLEAIKLLCQYVIGKPAQTVDPDRLDVDEWEKVLERARPAEEAAGVLEQLPAEMACELTRQGWPDAVERNLTAPLEQLEAIAESDAWRPASARQQARRVKRRAKDRKAGGQRAVAGDRPIPNGDNGDPGDWLRRMVAEAMALSRAGTTKDRPSPNGRNGGG